MTIKARLGWTMLALGLLLALVATLGLVGMNNSNEVNRQTFARRLASSKVQAFVQFLCEAFPGGAL